MSTAAGRQALHERRNAECMRNLRQQLNASRTNLTKAQRKIQELTKQVADLMREQSFKDLTQSPYDRIYLDILKNRSRKPNGRRYSIETLLWTEEIHAVSPQALQVVRKVLDLPCESLLNSKFTRSRRIVSDALQDSNRIGELIDLWEQSCRSTRHSRTVILAVDAVAFRPLVTITEDGEVGGLKHLKHLDDPDLFTEFLRDPESFSHFLEAHWKDAYSDLFAFQMQPVDPALPCCVIHVYPAENGKGNLQTVETLLALKERLEVDYAFSVVGLAFDGDSCFGRLHEEFANQWRAAILENPQVVPRIVFKPLVICDPLHLLKRIRYRLLARFKFSSAEEHTEFNLQTIQSAHILSPIVFNNSHESKMHDSLPLELFSLKTLSYILYHPVIGETMMVPWCLLVIALTLRDLSTWERLDFLEVGFWMLFLYENPDFLPDPPNIMNLTFPRPRRCGNDQHSLYTKVQLRDSLNTFIALIILISSLDSRFCLNRFGSNPLEHAFGLARIRCRDINTMTRLIGALSRDYTIASIENFLSIAAVPKRRLSIGLDCQPLAAEPQPILRWDTQLIARSLLVRSANPSNLVHQFMPPPLILTAWSELKKISGVTPSLDHARLVSPDAGIKGARLSSDQIFLGIVKSPRAAHLIKAPSKMRQALEAGVPPQEI
jgi:hypothetical protein